MLLNATVSDDPSPQRLVGKDFPFMKNDQWKGWIRLREIDDGTCTRQRMPSWISGLQKAQGSSGSIAQAPCENRMTLRCMAGWARA